LKSSLRARREWAAAWRRLQNVSKTPVES
jgi:hypothetical protein